MAIQRKFWILAIFFVFLAVGSAQAQETGSAFRATSFPLPRFVSLGSEEIYVRAGPGQRYPVEWVYKKKGIPVEIILEYDVWRKVRDFDGQVGWVHHTLLSGKRAAFVNTAAQIPLSKKPVPNAAVLAILEPKVLVQIEECASGWCYVNASGYKGWAEQKNLWGVYESEEFD
jgi:SH3-like domain-containing protein